MRTEEDRKGPDFVGQQVGERLDCLSCVLHSLSLRVQLLLQYCVVLRGLFLHTCTTNIPPDPVIRPNQENLNSNTETRGRVNVRIVSTIYDPLATPFENAKCLKYSMIFHTQLYIAKVRTQHLYASIGVYTNLLMIKLPCTPICHPLT